MKSLYDAGIDNVFFWINPVEKCTQSFPQERKSDVMMSFGLFARLTVYDKAGTPLYHTIPCTMYTESQIYTKKLLLVDGPQKFLQNHRRRAVLYLKFLSFLTTL
jgi:hypothetical protein